MIFCRYARGTSWLLRWAATFTGLEERDLDPESVRERSEGDGEFDGGKL